MHCEERWLLRPEEIAFIGLFGLVLILHLMLREPYCILVWLRHTWVESTGFRFGMAFTTLAGLVAGFVSIFGSPLVKLRTRQGLAILRDFFPFGFMYIVYEGLHAIGPKLHGRVYDELLMRADLLIFHTRVFVALPEKVFETSHVLTITYYLAFCYSAVFVVYWGMGVYFRFFCDRQIFRRYMLTVVLTSFMGYTGYLIFPAVGPYEAFMRFGLFDMGDWSGFGAIQSISTFADHIRSFHLDRMPASDAFPSLHTAWAVIMVAFAAAYANRLLWVMVPWAVGTVVGALYFQQHYLIDVMGGFAVAALGSACASLLVERNTGRFVSQDVQYRVRSESLYRR